MDTGFISIAIVFAGIVILPVIIIRLAKSVKAVKDKKAASSDSK